MVNNQKSAKPKATAPQDYKTSSSGFAFISPSQAAALNVVRLWGDDVPLLFEGRLPDYGEAQRLLTMRNVDQGLIHRSADGSWLFTPHGGFGVQAALRESAKAQGLIENKTPAYDPDFASGLNAYQRAALELLPILPTKASMKRVLEALQKADQKHFEHHQHNFSPEDFVQSWQAIKAWLRLPQVALIGPANAGKSTLFNLLADNNQAFVDDQAGTTRDAIKGMWKLSQNTFTEILDTPGFHQQAFTQKSSEASAITLGMQWAEKADLRLYLQPVDQPELLSENLPQKANHILFRSTNTLKIATKLDLLENPLSLPEWAELGISAEEKRGLKELSARVQALLFPQLPEMDLIPLNQTMVDQAYDKDFLHNWL